MTDFTPLQEKQLKEIALEQETILNFFQPMPDHGIDHISGMADLKERLRSICEQDIFEELIPASYKEAYLFHGVAGTGKTYYAEALVHELMEKGFRYMRLTFADIISSLLGVAERIIRTVFETAAEYAPCIILIEGIEQVCKNREDPSVKNWERNLTVTFLQGFSYIMNYNRNQKEKPVMLIGVATYPERLDPALRDRMQKIEVGLPDAEARKMDFENHLKGIALESGLSYELMSEQTEGRNYSELSMIYRKIVQGLRKAAQQAAGSGENPESFERDICEGKISLTAEMFRSVLEK